MGGKRKGGLSDGESKVMSFRLPIDVHDAFVAKIDASGLTKSEYVRDYVLQEKTQVIARPKASFEKQRMLFLLSKVSNNLNQIAHRANSENKAGVIDAAFYEAILRELSDMNAYLKKVVGNVD